MKVMHNSRIAAAKYGGYNFRYAVHYIGHDGRDILFGASAHLEDANEMAERCALGIFESPWESDKSKFRILDSIYVYDGDTGNADMMNYQTEEYIDNLMSQLDSQM